MSRPTIGVIGGTGLGEALSRGEHSEIVNLDTPFGPPSSPVKIIEWENGTAAFLSRHGPGHTLNPSQVPYRANIFALKKMGVTQVIASGATGSLREEIQPRDLVVVDQVIDKTFRRPGTFFDHDLAVHVEFSHPFCERLRQVLLAQGESVSARIHDGGTYVCMEGPQFSTAAESRMHRSWGGDVIGMTCMPEAKLAREAEMCYALVALATDYDSWRAPANHRTGPALLEEIVQNLEAATQSAIALVRSAVGELARQLPAECPCAHALERAIWSDKSRLSTTRLQPLRPLLEKHLPFGE